MKPVREEYTELDDHWHLVLWYEDGTMMSMQGEMEEPSESPQRRLPMDTAMPDYMRRAFPEW